MTKKLVMKQISRLTLGFLLASPALAVERAQVESLAWRGQLGAESLLFLKPSGAAGTSRFQIPFAGLELSAELSGGVRAEFELTYQSPVAAGAELNPQRASLSTPVGEGGLRFRAGLFEPAWLEGAEAFWPYDRYSRDLGWAFERWGYLRAADYGAELYHRTEGGGFGVAVVNGEGVGAVEQGPQKDFHVWGGLDWRGEDGRRTELLLAAVRGGYENVPAVDAAKERLMLSLRSAAPAGWLAGAEALFARDPADSVNGRVADAADLIDRGGERIAGRLATLSLGYRSERPEGGGRHTFVARADAVEPIAGESDRGVTSTQWMYLYSPSPGAEWLVQISNLDYGDGHSNAIRDENTWRVSYHVRWD